MVLIEAYGTREEWLKARTSYIGGSDAASILGLNPWKTNVQLWREKTGRERPANLSDNRLVQYGTQAERRLRELFELDYPEYAVEYMEHNMITNDKFPWAHASLDGILTEKETGRRGVLEIKTSTIMQAAQREKWNGCIPDNYFIQVLHYLMVTESDFAVVKAQLKSENGWDVRLDTRHYLIERKEVEADIEYLRKAEYDFYRKIKDDIEPPLILPRI